MSNKTMRIEILELKLLNAGEEIHLLRQVAKKAHNLLDWHSEHDGIVSIPEPQYTELDEALCDLLAFDAYKGKNND